MRCANCGRVNADDAAYCSACGTRLEPACPSCGAPYEAGSAFCSRCGTALTEAAPPETDLVRYVPAELLEKLHAARRGRTMAGERRMVTMLFADVQGSTAAAEQLDPEEWADVINGAFDRLIRPVYRYEGTLARLMGDAVLAFFGAPIAHEDDPERAVRAGLAMLQDARPYAREAKAKWGVEFDLRVGINTGLVVVGEVGSDLRVEYTAVGDAVNVAARMEQAAEPGTLLISAATQRLVGSLFEYDAMPPIAVKGKSEPVAAFRVIAPSQAREASRGAGDAPFVGREQELGTLRRVTDEVRGGRGQIASVIGEAGVGKSRLVETLRTELAASDCLAPWQGPEAPGADKMRWAAVRCLSYNTSVAYAPFHDLFTAAFGLEPDDDPGIARERVAAAVEAADPDDPVRAVTYLCALLGIEAADGEASIVAELPAPTLQRRIFSAVVDYVRSCASAAPAMIVLDDLHWADSVSLALLEELLQATDRTMLGVIALMRPYRDDPAWRFHETAQRSFSHRYTVTHLEPLDSDASRTLLRGLVERGLPETMEATVLQRAEGNPLFVEEIARSLVETGALDDVPEAGRTTPIPENVSALLTSRLDRLGGGSKLVAQLASVLGREFGFGELAALVGDAEETEQAVADLLRRDLIVERSRLPEREYAFRHALIQETAYSTVLLKERRALHAQVADYLEPRHPDPQEMARHLEESDQEARAVPYLVAAGDRAVRAMSLADAIRLYDRALAWATDSDSDLALRAHEGLGSAFTLIPDLTRAAASYQRMLEYGKARAEPSVQITALNRLGFATAFLGGDLESATGYLEDARRLAEDAGDQMGLAEYHMNSCMIATARGDMEKAAGHDAETARLGSEVGSDQVRVGGLLQRAQSLLYGARFEEGRRALEHARKATEGSDDVAVQSSIAASDVILLMRDGRLAEAWEAGRRSAELATGMGSSKASVIGLQAGIAAAAIGDFENALAYLAESARLGEELGQPFNSAAAAASMVRIYTELGMRGDDVDGLRRTAVGYLGAPMGGTLASTVHAQLGWAALEEGDVEGALEHFETGLAGTSASRQLETPPLLLGLASARVAAGDISGAAPLVTEGSAFVEERGMAHQRPLAAAARGTVELASGRAGDAARTFEEGAAQAEAIGADHMWWRLLASGAGALRAAGRGTEADEATAAAERVVEEMATRFADTAIRDAFVETSRSRLRVLAGADAG